ncbi:MAG: co-chaperone GroES [Bdellovibrionaceae bacterium]|nr:co-chaperone GroES [Pseudobdellovibrionaceae bacterium]
MATTDVKIRPLHDRILVRRMKEDDKTAGGIIIPDTAKEKPQKGEVVATGNGRVNEDGKVFPLEVKKGDKVLFSKYAGTDLKLGSDEFLMITETDVLGIIN